MLTYEEVETILIGIEGVLNCRPLCYVDDSDISEPLTPSHLMYGRNLQRKAILHDEPKSDELPPSARVKHVRKLQNPFGNVSRRNMSPHFVNEMLRNGRDPNVSAI